MYCVIIMYIGLAIVSFPFQVVMSYVTISPFDVKRVLVHNIRGTVMCISYYDFVFSLQMAVIAETCC